MTKEIKYSTVFQKRGRMKGKEDLKKCHLCWTLKDGWDSTSKGKHRACMVWEEQPLCDVTQV